MFFKLPSLRVGSAKHFCGILWLVQSLNLGQMRPMCRTFFNIPTIDLSHKCDFWRLDLACWESNFLMPHHQPACPELDVPTFLVTPHSLSLSLPFERSERSCSQCSHDFYSLFCCYSLADGFQEWADKWGKNTRNTPGIHTFNDWTDPHNLVKVISIHCGTCEKTICSQTSHHKHHVCVFT